MIYNFDKIINRKGTCCTKWDSLEERFTRKDLISMWIADMDFKTPDFFTKALVNRIGDGVLGYGCRPNEWYESVIKWFNKRYSWKIKKENIGFVPGIVLGLCHALRCFTKPGDKVLIMPPVYFPFKNQILAAGCKVVNNKLLLVEKKTKKGIVERFEVDWTDFENKIKGCKMFILCNPHNPGGRVWSREELKKMADICLKNKVMVLSDEIHCDLYSKKHIPFATVNSKQALNTITFHAPSKTFNCAGMCASEWITTSKAIKDKFQSYLSAGDFDNAHCLAYYPAMLLYSDKGEEWLSQALSYIDGNIEFVTKFLRENFTIDGKQMVSMILPEASFLVFLNFRNLKMSQKKLVDFIINDSKLALNDGSTFGPGGEGFMRLNVGCPRAVLEKALKQLLVAFKKKFK